MLNIENYVPVIKHHGFNTKKDVNLFGQTTLHGGLLDVNSGVYNVSFYGAVGDGVTDDWAAIMAAIAAADQSSGTVFFPAGKVYLVSQPIVYDKTASTKSIPAVSLVGSPGRSGPSPDFAANTTEWNTTCAVTIKCSSSFPIGEYVIDWLGPTAQDRSICGYKISGFVIDCNSRGAGVRNFNPFSASLCDMVIANTPRTPAPAYAASGTNTGAFCISGNPSQNSFHNTIERIYVQNAQMDGIQLSSGSGSFDLVSMCCVNNSGRYGYNIEDKCTVVNCLAQANAKTKGQFGADFKLGRYNVTMIGCIAFSGKPSYGNGLRLNGGSAAIQKIIGCTLYGPINAEQDQTEANSAVVQVSGALQNAEFVGCHLLTGVSTFTSDFVYLSASASGRITFTGCQFMTEQGSALTNVLVNANGKESVLSFVNCHGLNPMTIKSQGNITGTATIDRKDGHIHTATLTGNVTFTITNGNVIGDLLTLKLIQDATGSRTATWPSNFKKVGGSLALSTAASAVDTIVAVWDGTNWNEVSRALALS